MFIGAPSSSVAGNVGSVSAKWNVENFRTSEGRAKCAASISKDNNVNKIPNSVFDATPNSRKGEHESMAEFYAKKYPHASLLFSDHAVQSAVLMAYVKNPEALNTHVHLAMASVAPCMTPAQQDEIVTQMGFDWDDIVKNQPDRAFILRFLHSTSDPSQNFLAKKISDGCWGRDELLSEYVCENANMFSFARPRALFVDAICSERLKFQSANATKMLAQAIYDGHFGDDPRLLAKITNKLESLFGANNINERSIHTYLETLNLLAQAVRFGRLGQDEQISQTFAAFRLAEIAKLFAPQASPDMKKALVDAMCKGKFGDAIEVRQMLVDKLPLFATNVADLESTNSFDKHLNALHDLAKFVFDQGFGKDRTILNKLAENTKIFIVDLKLFSGAKLHLLNDSKMREIQKQITLSIVTEKFKGMAAGGAALEQLERFKDNVHGYSWDLRTFTGLGFVSGSVSAGQTAMDVDVQRETLAGGKRRNESEDADVGDAKRQRPAAPAALLAGIKAGASLRKNENGPSSDVAVGDGRPRAPVGLLAGIQAGIRLKSRTVGEGGQNPDASSPIPVSASEQRVSASTPAAPKLANAPAKPNFLAELQASAQKSAASRAGKALDPVSQTPKKKTGLESLLSSEGSSTVLAEALKRRRTNMGEDSTDSTPDKWANKK